MSTTIKIGKFNKKVNSTACQGFSGTSYNCTLREKCDIRNPTVIVEGSAGNYNYAEWSGRYYWVDKVIPYPNGIIEVHMHLDPLATYKTDIHNTYAYMSFNSQLMTVDIDDPRMQPELVEERSTQISDIFASTPTPQNGSVIITTFECGLGSANQGVKTYALSLSGFLAMLANFQTSLYESQYNTGSISSSINNAMSNFSDPDNIVNMIGAGLSAVGHDLLKAITDIVNNVGGVGSWADNLLKAVYVPIPISAYSGTSKQIYMGYAPANGTGILVDPVDVRTKTTSGVIPWSSHVTQFHFVKHAKYTKLQAICNGGQFVDINTDLIRNKADSASLYCHSAIDICSGEWGAVITDDSSINALRLAGFGGNMGIDIKGLAGKGGLGAGMNYVTGGFKIAASALSMGLSQSIGGTESGIQMATGITANFIQSPVGGTGSGVSGNNIASMFLNGSTGYNDIALVSKTFYPAILDGTGAGSYDSYCQKYGFPCNQYGMLGSYTGAFIKCEGAVVSCEGNQQDQAFINATMNSGIYIEN